MANIKNTNTLNSKENELLKNYNKADKTTQEIVDKILNIKSKTGFKYSSLNEENKLAQNIIIVQNIYAVSLPTVERRCKHK